METGLMNTYSMTQSTFKHHKSMENSYSESTEESACNSTCASTSPETQEGVFKARTSTLCEDGQSVEEFTTQIQDHQWGESDISSVKDESDSEFSDDFTSQDQDFAEEDLNHTNGQCIQFRHDPIQIDEACIDFDSSIQIITVNPDSSYESDTSSERSSTSSSNSSSISSLLLSITQYKKIKYENENQDVRIMDSSTPIRFDGNTNRKMNKSNSKRKRQKNQNTASGKSQALSNVSDSDCDTDIENYISDLNNLHIKNNDLHDILITPPLKMNEDLPIQFLDKNIKEINPTIKTDSEVSNFKADNYNHMGTNAFTNYNSEFTYDDMELECPIEGKIDDHSSLHEEADVSTVSVNKPKYPIKTKLGGSLLDYCLEKPSDPFSNEDESKSDLSFQLPSRPMSDISSPVKLEKNTVRLEGTMERINIGNDVDAFDVKSDLSLQFSSMPIPDICLPVKLEKDGRKMEDTLETIGIGNDVDEFVDIESFTDSEALPVLAANNLTSLLEQFEKTEKFNFLDCFNTSEVQSDIFPGENLIDSFNFGTFANKEGGNSLVTGHAPRMSDAIKQMSKNKMLQLMSPTSGKNTGLNLNSSNESIHLDHDYCSPSKKVISDTPLKCNQNNSQSSISGSTDCETDLSACNVPTTEDRFHSPVRADILKSIIPYYSIQKVQMGLGKGKCISNLNSSCTNIPEASSGPNKELNFIANKSNHRKKDSQSVSNNSTSSDHCYTKTNLNSLLISNKHNNISNNCDTMIKNESVGALQQENNLKDSLISSQTVNICKNKSINSLKCDKAFSPRNSKSLLKTSLLLPKEESISGNYLSLGDGSKMKSNAKECSNRPQQTLSSSAQPMHKNGAKISLLKCNYLKEIQEDNQIVNNMPSSCIAPVLNGVANTVEYSEQTSVNNVPRKRKLNLQEYKLRREGKSNDSSRTNSPITVTIAEFTDSPKPVDKMSAYPELSVTDMLKNVLTGKNTLAKLNIMTEASPQTSINADVEKNTNKKSEENKSTREDTKLLLKKRKVAALRKTEDKIVSSKIPKVDLVEILPLTLSSSECNFIESSNVIEMESENTCVRVKSPEYEEIVMVSIGVNTIPIEEEQFSININTAVEQVDAAKSGTVNFKITKKKVLSRNPLFEMNSDTDDDPPEDKVNGYVIQKELFIGKPISVIPLLTKKDKLNIAKNLKDVPKLNLKRSKHESSAIPSTANVNSNSAMLLLDDKTKEVKIKVDSHYNSIENMNFDCREHGEDKVIMHLKKDRAKPEITSVEIQTDDDIIFLPLSVILSRVNETNNQTLPQELDEKMDITENANGENCKMAIDSPKLEFLSESTKNDVINENQLSVNGRSNASDTESRRSYSDRSRRRNSRRDRSRSIDYSRKSKSYKHRTSYRSSERRRPYRECSPDTRSSITPPRKMLNSMGKFYARSRGNGIGDRNYRRSNRRSSSGSCSGSSDLGSSSSKVSCSSMRSHNSVHSKRNTIKESVSRSTLSPTSQLPSMSSESISWRSSSSRSISSTDSYKGRRSRNSGRSYRSDRRERGNSRSSRERLKRPKARSREDKVSLDDIECERPVEERRVVFVGRLEKDITKLNLRRAFDQFGPIKDVTLHKKEDGSRYGFLTFAHAGDAWVAVGEAHRVPTLTKYDVSFGGRRAFCRKRYADLDNIEMDYEDEMLPHFGPVIPPPPRNDELSFDRLLNEMKRTLNKRKGNCDRDRKSD